MLILTLKWIVLFSQLIYYALTQKYFIFSHYFLRAYNLVYQRMPAPHTSPHFWTDKKSRLGGKTTTTRAGFRVFNCRSALPRVPYLEKP